MFLGFAFFSTPLPAIPKPCHRFRQVGIFLNYEYLLVLYCSASVGRESEGMVLSHKNELVKWL